jgi:cellulose synthase operon protein C
LRYQGGEQRQALDAAKRALIEGPDNPRAIEFQAQLVRDAGGQAAALPLFERALSLAPNDLPLLQGYAASLGELSRANEMLAVTRKILSIDPGNVQAFYLQAVLAARVGKVDLARAMLNRIGKRMDDVPAAILLSGALELEAGNANVAAQRLIPLADRQSANPRVQLLLARALLESGDYQQLFARFGRLAERGDASPYLLSILGRALEDLGDRAGAAQLLDRAAAANPPELMSILERDQPGVLAPRWNERPADPALAVPFVRALLGAGDVAGARRAAERFTELQSGSAEAQGLMGDVELLTGQPLAALPRFADAGKVRMTDQLVLRMAIAFEKSGQGGQVPALVSGYLGIRPNSRLMIGIAANLAIAAKDWGKAQLLLESLRLRGGNRDGRLLISLALAQLRGGNAKAALATAERASLIAPASGFAATVHALALAQSGGDADLARQLIALARKTGGDPVVLAEAERKLR